MLARESLRNLLDFLRAALFISMTKTLCTAIGKGLLTMFPGLTYAAVRKHLPNSIATSNDHLDQQRQGIQSTQPPASSTESPTDTFPAVPNRRRQNIYAGCALITGRVHSDQIGRFISFSNRGMNYLLIVHHEDFNAILAEPMQN